MKLDNTIYKILILTFSFMLVLSPVMIVLSALELGANAEDISGKIIKIVVFAILFIVAGAGLGIIISVKHSASRKIKYDNDKKD